MYRYIKSAVGLLLAAMMLASCGDKRSQLQPIESPKPNTQTVVQDPTKPPEENPSIPSNPTPEKPTPEKPTEPVGPIDPIDPDVPEKDEPSSYPLRINEVLYENSVFRFEGKEVYSFVELYNYGNEEINLDGFTLSVGSAKATLSGKVGAREYKLIFPGAEAEPSLGISLLTMRLSPKCTLKLRDKEGYLIQSLTLPELQKDISYGYKAAFAGTYVADDYLTTPYVTPGYENTVAGLEKWYQNNDNPTGLIINEVMNANRMYLKTLGSYYDWIELKNVSDSPISLADYYLSDKESKLQKWNLPDKTLAPGQTYVVFAEKDDNELLLSRGYESCGFSLSADREQIYLSNSDGKIVDAMVVDITTQNGSYGRMDGKSGFFYFDTPTPAENNKNGKRMIATTPVFSNSGGVYNNSNGVSVTISGEGTIYYTLDGSAPTEKSKRYNGESITLSKTSVLRAVSVSDGKWNSRPATASFIINENHTLPVLSIALNPEDMYGDKTGIYVVGSGNDPDAWAGEANYTQNWEKTAHAAYFETDGSGFALDCGIKIAGSGTRAFPKKSFQLKFRGIYGNSGLEYDLFGTGIESFENIKLRCGEDYYRTTFRDELQGSLVMEMEKVLAQRYRWFVLYIDGEYFGLYAFRDMTDEDYVAKVENCDPNDVFILEHDGVGEIAGKRDYFKEFMDFVSFCEKNDLANYENYRYVTERLDIESFTRWFIARSYGSDRDFGNCRFYRIGDDDKWKLIFYDCDWGFYYMYMERSPYEVLTQSRYNVFPAVKMMKALLKNPEYRDYFLTELGNQLRNVYTAENILPKIEAFDSLLHPEIARDRERWYDKDHPGTYDKYVYMVEELKKFAKECPPILINSTKAYFKLTDAQVQQYFAGLI